MPSLSIIAPPPPRENAWRFINFKKEKKTSSPRALKEVNYDSQSHQSVLFQMYGSVWPKVLPFCLANVSLTLIVLYLRNRQIVDLTFSDKGHSFISMLVSFLVVSRSQMIYGRYSEARSQLSAAMRSCRELVQHMAFLTLSETDGAAKEWRCTVAYKTILMLRVLCAALEYPTSKRNAWDVPEMDDADRNVVLDSLLVATSDNSIIHCSNNKLSPRSMHELAHGERSPSDENLRVPVIMTYQVREAIVSQRHVLSQPLQPPEELKILQFVSEFSMAFHSLRKLLMTPFPFPLVQMARTVLVFWVFSLPFVLVWNISEPIQVVMVVFVITYGFVGLEYVSMELEDPFGDDPNDFDCITFSQMVFEDIYITLNEVDGKEAANALRRKVKNRTAVGSTHESFVADDEFLLKVGSMEGSPLIAENGSHDV